MIRLISFLIAGALYGGLVAPQLAAQGTLGTLTQGKYVCALPGDATGAAWTEVEGRDFTITGASSYRTSQGNGTYLLEGGKVTFTRGPLKGQQFLRVGSGLLQEVDKGGHLGRLRCHRAGA